MRLQHTSPDLSEPTRLTVLGLLNSRLSDCLDLRARNRQDSCNMKGPYLRGLHRLFDDINEEVEHDLDTIAERAALLGGKGEGTTRAVPGRLPLRENLAAFRPGRDDINALADTLVSFRKNVRQAIGQADEAGDPVTAGVFNRVASRIDKWLWMVQANLQEG